MNILVCVKHVVDSTEVRVDKNSGELVLRGIPTKINDYDKNAIEEAVKIKKAAGGTVTLLTIGPKEAFKTIKEGLAMGADKAYIVDDSELSIEDPIQISKILASVAQTLGAFDIIFCGTISEDRGNSLTGPCLAEYLDMEHIAYVNALELKGQTLEAQRMVDQVVETIECSLPTVVTVDRSINNPRLPTAIQVMKVPANKIVKWTLDDIGLSTPPANQIRQTGYQVVSNDRKNVIIDGDVASSADQLFKHLVEEGVL